MKRAAILVLAIATLVMIVSPSAYPLATAASPGKTGTSAPSIIAPSTTSAGPSTTDGDTGGGTDQGDADGLSGLKYKPSQGTNYATADRVAITMMMWWRFMLLIR